MWGLLIRPVVGFIARRLTARQVVQRAAPTVYGMTPHSQQQPRDQVRISSEARRCERPTPSMPNFSAWE